MVQLREGTQKIVDMYNDKNNGNSFYMDDSFYKNQVMRGAVTVTYDEFAKYEHDLDNQKCDDKQAIVNHVMEFLDRDDRAYIDEQMYDVAREYLKDDRASDLSEDESDLAGHLIGHIRANDDSYEMTEMKKFEDMVEFEGGYKKYFVSYSDLNDFDKDLDEQLSDKIADGISMNEVVENFNELSQAEQLDHDENDLNPGTQKIVDMYTEKYTVTNDIDEHSYYMHDARRSHPEVVEMENILDEHKFDNSQSLVNNVSTFLDRDDRDFIEYFELDKELNRTSSELIDQIRATDDTNNVKALKQEAEDLTHEFGAPTKYFVTSDDLKEFDNDLNKHLSDKISDGMSMKEVVENFKELSQAQADRKAQETGNERVEQLELNLEGLDDESDLFPGK